MKLIPDWKQSPRWWSMRIAAFIAVLEFGQQLLPVWSGYIPAWSTPVLLTVLMVARVIDQKVDEHVQQD